MENLDKIQNNKEYRTENHSEFFACLEKDVMNSEDIQNIIDLIFEFPEEIAVAEKITFERGNDKLAYALLENFVDANEKKLSSVILNSNNPETNYLFAHNISEEFVEKQQKIVLNSGDEKYIYLFARDIAEANIEVLEKAILSTKNIQYITKFANDIEGCNKKKLIKCAKEFESMEL